MEVVVQQLKRKLFLVEPGQWTEVRIKARKFGTALEAIAYCAGCRLREVRLLGRGADDRDVYFYPFGGDPAVRAERRRIRRGIAESRRLKHERQTIRARIDILLAEAKEKKKQFPFKRKTIGEEVEPGGEGEVKIV